MNVSHPLNQQNVSNNIQNQPYSNYYYRQETKGEGKQKVQQEEEKAQK